MMFSATRTAARVLVALGAAMPLRAAIAQIDVVTERYDDSRLGANLSETTLDTTNVNVGDFGKLWSYTVSGSVYAQPLYVRNVTIPGHGTHNVLYVVTMNDIVYAFDADSPTDAPLLSFDITTQVPGSTPVPILDIIGFNDNIIGNVGLESTPHIDLDSGTMYLVARTEEAGGGCGGPHPTFCQRLHALDITTFEERPNSPVLIGGTVQGTGSGSSGGMLPFDTKSEDQRASLAYSNGRIFIAWAAHSDQLNYHGWVMAYDATTLQQTMIWSSAPDGSTSNGAGIWMAGRAPAIDAVGNVYYTTGNGKWDGVDNFGESVVKFGPTPDSPLLDWFTPDDVTLLNNFDLDLSGSGTMLLPGTSLVLAGGKSGYFYLVHTDDLGHRSSGDVNAAQVFENSESHDEYDEIKGGPVYWNRDGGAGPWMYVWSDGCNHFNAYAFDATASPPFNETPVSQSTMLSPCGASGGVLTLTANGSTPGSGIVWASMPTSANGNSDVHAGILRAFNADDLSTELWNSNQNQARDSAGNWPKFSGPTVVNGRVYLASFPSDGIADAVVNVYGLLVPVVDFALSATPPNPGVNPGGNVAYTINLSPSNGFSSPVHLDVGGLLSGVGATFAENDLTPPAQTTLTLDVASSVVPGEYPITINASSGALQHSVDNGLYVTEARPGDGIVGIDFVGGGTALQAIGLAGVLPKPNWNAVPNASGSGLALVDESGVDTGATLDWNSGDSGMLGLIDDAPDFVMMNGYLDADSQTTTVTVAGLPPNSGGHFVYVYVDGDNGATSVASTYKLEGTDGTIATARVVDDANTTFHGTFVNAIGQGGHGNYVVLLVGGSGFTLTAQSSIIGGGPHTPLNGIQIAHADRLFANGFE